MSPSIQKFSYQGLSPPRRLWRHRWNSDPYVLGGWAYQSTSSADEDIAAIAQPLPSPSDPRLLFAGEATDRRYLGTLLGARLVPGEQYCLKIPLKSLILRIQFNHENSNESFLVVFIPNVEHLLGCTMELIFYRNAEAISLGRKGCKARQKLSEKINGLATAK